MDNHFLLTLSVIFGSAAMMATLALFTRQSLLVAYLVVGMLLGPYALAWVPDARILQSLSDVGLLVLLFLLGVKLQPQNLFRIFKESLTITLASGVLCAVLGVALAHAFGFQGMNAWVLGVSCVFSSTILCLRLMPEHMLRFQRVGELLVGVLLLQDMLAIFFLLLLDLGELSWKNAPLFAQVFLSLPVLGGMAFLVERFVLRWLFFRFQKIHEFLFLLTVAWCFMMSQLAVFWGLSSLIGAFIAGISLSQSPFAHFFDESLKPLRDFFMVLFFFAVGASVNVLEVIPLWQPVLAFGLFQVFGKFFMMRPFMRWCPLNSSEATEASVRLAHGSEFSLIISLVAYNKGLIDLSTHTVIQTSALVSFVLASGWMVLFFTTPISPEKPSSLPAQ